MNETIKTTNDYIKTVPEERKEIFLKLLNIIRKNIPDGFVEQINYGMIGFVVPKNIYPKGYHANPKEPLPFINLASQKHHIAIYHMGIYSDLETLSWFKKKYSKKIKTKLDMGKSCIRFKNFNNIPFDLITELVQKISLNQWIEMYEKSLNK